VPLPEFTLVDDLSLPFLVNKLTEEKASLTDPFGWRAGTPY